MDRIVLQSPAKINIGLNIVSKRKDGYHNLETVFYPLMLSDNFQIEKSDDYELITNSDELNNKEDNLITKCKNLLENFSGKELIVKIKVIKKIPIGAGLGGGSSNAAITLRALNLLFNLGLTYSQLSALALKLGSDVPYFLNPVPAYGNSRGEVLTPLKFELSYPILLVNPGINVSTKRAFGKISPSKPKINLYELLNAKTIDFDKMKKYIVNDFEHIVFDEYPEIGKLKEELYKQGAEFALMSGTGSTVYGIFTNLQKAFWAEEIFKQKCFTYLNNPFQKGSIT
jgi:4-diphosphocytidyl-2-C-methyl-D-erythritol kinase